MKVLVTIVFSLFVFAGCSAQSTPSTQTPTKTAVNTTLTGTITKAGTTFILSSPGKAPTEVSSYTVKLDEYVGKNVSVTGQYSGTTLFIDTVKQ